MARMLKGTRGLSILRNLVIDLAKYKKVCTTITIAKELRRMFDKSITKVKRSTNNLHTRRQLLGLLYNQKEAVEQLFLLGDKFKDRPGGYTSIVRAGYRNDGAVKAYISVVD